MYEVGQVLFVVLNKRPQIIPVQVIEQVVRRSLKGEETQYSVNVPTKDGDKVFELAGLDGEVYDDLQSVHNAMFENARSTILEMTARAQTVAETRFGYEKPNSPLQDLELPEPNLGSNNVEKEDKVKVTLDDGVVANILLPEGMEKGEL